MVIWSLISFVVLVSELSGPAVTSVFLMTVSVGLSFPFGYIVAGAS